MYRIQNLIPSANTQLLVILSLENFSLYKFMLRIAYFREIIGDNFVPISTYITYYK